MSKNALVVMQAAGQPPPDFALDQLRGIGLDVGQLAFVNQAGEKWRRSDSGWHKVTEPPKETTLPRILAITPTHPGYGIKPQTWKSIQDALMVYTGPIDWILSNNDNPEKTGAENVTHQHNKARGMALAGDYDYLLSIESDMVVPPDTIPRLLACNADIAYGVYVWRHMRKRWSAYTELGLFGGESVAAETGENARAAWGQVIDVAGLGMGCTLISRRALEQLQFRLYEGAADDWLIEHYGEVMAQHGIDPFRRRPTMLCDDYLLALDAQYHGFSQRCDLGLVCGHIHGGSVLWPDPDEKQLFREEIIGEQNG